MGVISEIVYFLITLFPVEVDGPIIADDDFQEHLLTMILQGNFLMQLEQLAANFRAAIIRVNAKCAATEGSDALIFLDAAQIQTNRLLAIQCDDGIFAGVAFRSEEMLEEDLLGQLHLNDVIGEADLESLVNRVFIRF